jgi:spore maturation protein CgeB
MFSGRFNDILVAGKHYIALERDFSNIDEVIERFTDADHWKLIVDEAYESVMDQHTYHHRLQRLYGALTCA